MILSPSEYSNIAPKWGSEQYPGDPGECMLEPYFRDVQHANRVSSWASGLLQFRLSDKDRRELQDSRDTAHDFVRKQERKQ